MAFLASVTLAVAPVRRVRQVACARLPAPENDAHARSVSHAARRVTGWAAISACPHQGLHIRPVTAIATIEVASV